MTRVLVPVAVLDGGTVSPGLIDLLGTVDVTVLGYHELPEQTPPDQARAQFEERAVGALEDITQEFRDAGGEAEYRLVFTHDRDQSVERIAAEVGADAYAITGATGSVERLLVPVDGETDADLIVEFSTALIGSRAIGVTILCTTDHGRTEDLQSIVDAFEGAGIDATTREVSGDPITQTGRESPGHDAVVMGERSPSLSSFVLGDDAERVAAASVGPVLVVRRGDDE